jgi:hypothetical protein
VASYAEENDLVCLDPRLVWLERAWARCVLVEACEIELDDAFDGLAQSFFYVAGPLFLACGTCGCQPCINPSFCRQGRLLDGQRRRTSR